MLVKDHMQEQGRWASSLVQWASSFSERHPRSYLALALVLILPGYFFLLLFPVLAFEGVRVLVEELSNVKTMEHWLVIEIWFAIILTCFFFCLQIFQLHFSRVQGLKISRELAPDLYALIADVRKHTSRPSIRNIVLTDQFELRLEETPRFGYPFLLSTTLVIGLPMLQTLSEGQFRGEVMRKIGQYSSGRFRITHWLYRTRLLWCKYHDALQKRKRFGEIPLRWFFSFYAPLFSVFTIPAARKDELAADTAVLEGLNDRDFFATVKSSTIAEIFLDAYYWKNIFRSVLENPQCVKNSLKPIEKLEHISGHLKSKEFRQKWLQGAFDAEQNILKVMPSLRIRMDNIGQSKLRGVPVVEKTAAACLGDSRKNYVSIIDKLWRSTTFGRWKTNYEKRQHDIQVVKGLSRKSQKKVLNVKEMLRYAKIAKCLRGDPLHRSIRKIMKRNLKNSRVTSFGRNFFKRKLKETRHANDIF